MKREVILNSPTRLHLTLIDLNGEIGRVDGGIGIALQEPTTIITARPSEEIEVRMPDNFNEHKRVYDAVKLAVEKFRAKPASVIVKGSVPSHIGLGTGTHLALGSAYATCRLCDIDPRVPELARALDRGGTSGIGVAIFEMGGLVVDGGHRFGEGKKEFLPSSASKDLPSPPVIARHDFPPEWDILIVIPEGRQTSGQTEVNLFNHYCPIPIEEVKELSHLILMKLLPALVERELETFGSAIERIQHLGFKKRELGTQIETVLDCMRFLRENGGLGVGMSSWGPTIYTFGYNLKSLLAKTQEYLDSHRGGTCFITKANNEGMRILHES
jgi:beta-ribofuranosylaminobenzene 5'-phosphate synthase